MHREPAPSAHTLIPHPPPPSPPGMGGVSAASGFWCPDPISLSPPCCPLPTVATDSLGLGDRGGRPSLCQHSLLPEEVCAQGDQTTLLVKSSGTQHSKTLFCILVANILVYSTQRAFGILAVLSQNFRSATQTCFQRENTKPGF